MLKLMDFENFVRWYTELGKLKIFWAKPVESVKLVREEEDISFIGIKWLVKGKVKRAVLAFVKREEKVAEGIRGLKEYKDSTKILIVPEDSFVNLNAINARSILYFWNTSTKTLKPNKDVKLEVYCKWGERELELFKRVHKQSWGFFIPPRLQDHIVILGFLHDEPVALAYLNTNNFNIDYGVHVVRLHWRKRIGTRILAELLKVAKSMGSSNVSVVRVFRSIRGTSSDIRAREFYKANNPLIRMSVFRLID